MQFNHVKYTPESCHIHVHRDRNCQAHQRCGLVLLQPRLPPGHGHNPFVAVSPAGCGHLANGLSRLTHDLQFHHNWQPHQLAGPFCPACLMMFAGGGKAASAPLLSGSFGTVVACCARACMWLMTAPSLLGACNPNLPSRSRYDLRKPASVMEHWRNMHTYVSSSL